MAFIIADGYNKNTGSLLLHTSTTRFCEGG